MQTFTNTQAVAILEFFANTVTRTLAQCKHELEDDNVLNMTQIRLYDSACVAEAYTALANCYTDNEDGSDVVFTFTVDDVDAAFTALDTEYRDSVYEWFLEDLDDDICRLVFNTTEAEYYAKYAV